MLNSTFNKLELLSCALLGFYASQNRFGKPTSSIVKGQAVEAQISLASQQDQDGTDPDTASKQSSKPV